MKKHSKILLISAIVLAAGLGVGGGITYAGYVKSATVNQTVSLKRYLFLNASRTLDDASEGHENWEVGNAVFYVYTWTENGDSTGGHWYPSLGKQDGVHVFYVSQVYAHCIFVRMNPLAPTGMWDYGNNYTWGQTGNLDIPNDKNVYTITSWHATNPAPANSPAVGNWSALKATMTVPNDPN